MIIYTKRIFVIIVASLVVYTQTIFSQEFNKLSLSGNFLPHSRDIDASFYSGSLSFTHSVYTSSKFIGLAGIHGQWSYYQIATDSLHINNLYSVGIPFTGIIPIKAHHQLIVVFEPVIASDFSSPSLTGLRYNSVIMYRWNNEGKASWDLGISLSKQFFGYQIIPFYNANIKLGNRITLSGMLPLNPKLSYKISEQSSTGINFSGMGNSFRLSGMLKDGYVDERQTSLTLFYQHSFSKQWKINLAVGSCRKRIMVFDKDQTVPLRLFLSDFGKTRQVSEEFKSRGACLQLTINYQFNRL